ncbi:MAG: hypothetical protein IPG99_15065 [Ignavibacteria bacterium]|nr:hypothetical protein [Ignavibacteria bacterium]
MMTIPIPSGIIQMISECLNPNPNYRKLNFFNEMAICFKTCVTGFDGILCRSQKLGQVVKVELINLSKNQGHGESRAGASSA